MNTWISEGIKARHWTCNALLGMIFVPLVMIDMIISFGLLFDDGRFNPDMLPCFFVGIMAVIGAYHLVLKNSLGGLCMGVSAVLMLEELLSYSDVVKYDMFDATELSTWAMFVKSLPNALLYASFMLVPSMIVLLIPKNWVPALLKLERRGVFTKLHYELPMELAIGILFVYTQS